MAQHYRKIDSDPGLPCFYCLSLSFEPKRYPRLNPGFRAVWPFFVLGPRTRHRPAQETQAWQQGFAKQLPWWLLFLGLQSSTVTAEKDSSAQFPLGKPISSNNSDESQTRISLLPVVRPSKNEGTLTSVGSRPETATKRIKRIERSKSRGTINRSNAFTTVRAKPGLLLGSTATARFVRSDPGLIYQTLLSRIIMSTPTEGRVGSREIITSIREKEGFTTVNINRESLSQLTGQVSTAVAMRHEATAVETLSVFDSARPYLFAETAGKTKITNEPYSFLRSSFFPLLVRTNAVMERYVLKNRQHNDRRRYLASLEMTGLQHLSSRPKGEISNRCQLLKNYMERSKQSVSIESKARKDKWDIGVQGASDAGTIEKAGQVFRFQAGDARGNATPIEQKDKRIVGQVVRPSLRPLPLQNGRLYAGSFFNVQNRFERLRTFSPIFTDRSRNRLPISRRFSDSRLTTASYSTVYPISQNRHGNNALVDRRMIPVHRVTPIRARRKSALYSEIPIVSRPSAKPVWKLNPVRPSMKRFPFFCMTNNLASRSSGLASPLANPLLPGSIVSTEQKRDVSRQTESYLRFATVVPFPSSSSRNLSLAIDHIENRLERKFDRKISEELEKKCEYLSRQVRDGSSKQNQASRVPRLVETESIEDDSARSLLKKMQALLEEEDFRRGILP